MEQFGWGSQQQEASLEHLSLSSMHPSSCLQWWRRSASRWVMHSTQHQGSYSQGVTLINRPAWLKITDKNSPGAKHHCGPQLRPHPQAEGSAPFPHVLLPQLLFIAWQTMRWVRRCIVCATAKEKLIPMEWDTERAKWYNCFKYI